VPGGRVMDIASIDQAYNRHARGVSGGKMMASGFWILGISSGWGLRGLINRGETEAWT